ncbi:MAG TPA: hypothetical protein VEU72_09370 [Nitrosopumilaceae archaeon]|nr:hypothetical protein [Nitrosopumilaceae archaeon]
MTSADNINGVFSINKDAVEQLAEKFFGQQQSNVMVRKAESKGRTWIVTVSTGMPPVLRKVRIDAKTGRILGVE